MTRDHVHYGALDCGRVKVGQGHVGVNGVVRDEVRGEEEEENCLGEGGRTEERNIWYTVREQWHIIYKIGLA